MLMDILDRDEVTLLKSIANSTRYPRGQTIVEEGGRTTDLLVIQRGRVRVQKRLDGTKYKNLNDLGAGEFFGEMSFLSGLPRSASVVALEDCELYELSRDAVDQLAERQPGIGLKLFRSLSEELSRRLKRNNDDLKSVLLMTINGMSSYP